MLLIYSALAFIFIIVFIFSIFLIFINKKKEKERIDTFFSSKENRKSKEKEKDNFNINVAGTVGKIKFSSSYKDKIKLKLVQANVQLKFEEFITIRLIAVVFTALAFLINTKDLITALISPLFVWVLINMILKLRYKSRIKKFESQLGDAIGILANGLKAGYSYMQAMKTLIKEMPEPISSEFNVLLKELSLGIESKEAMAHLSERIESENLNLMINAMLIQQETGGNLAEILETIAKTIRERVKIKGEMRTLTAQGKLSGFIIGLVPFLVVGALFVVNPEYANILIETNLGRMIIIGSMVSELIGAFFIYKIINIKF